LAVFFGRFHAPFDFDLSKPFFFKVLDVILAGLVGVGWSGFLMRLDNIDWNKVYEYIPFLIPRMKGRTFGKS